MKILGVHADVCHLGGHTRLFLMMCDIFKSMGYKVHIVARTKEAMSTEAKVPFMDPKTRKPMLIPTTVTAEMKLSHHSVQNLKMFQPLKYINPNDITMHDIPVIYWGNHFLTPWAPEVLAKMEEADYVFCDTEMYVRLETGVEIADKHIQFVHFPTQNLMPVYTREPKRVWANSMFTQSWIRIRWGYNNPNYTKLGKKYAVIKIPRQIFQAEVVNPPLYVEDYKNNVGFDERPHDVVMFARLGEDKFTVSGFLNERFKLLTMGALSPVRTPGKPKQVFKPEGKLHATVTFKQVVDLLKKAKVYVHGKGFGQLSTGGESLPEHFGITICEAMASGCPVIVPRRGGCWTDISMHGKYTLGYSSLEELESHVKLLTTKKEEWTKWHNLALERVEAFDVEKCKARIKQLLD